MSRRTRIVRWAKIVHLRAGCAKIRAAAISYDSRAVSLDSNKLDMIIQPCEPTVMRPHQLRLYEKQALTTEAVCEELH